MIGDFQHYLWILKTTHGGTDVDTALEMAKGSLSEELRYILYDLLANRDAWWVPGKIVEARRQLAAVWQVSAWAQHVR
jgi:alpha-glucan, water dikinase